MGPQNLPERLHEVRMRIARAAEEAGRSAQSVTILAVGKAQPVALLDAAADCGLRDFGESYLQEALAKIEKLASRNLTWHFVGRVQANKTRPIAESFSWVHAIDRVHIAERLAAQRSPQAAPLNVCLAVNLGGEASKGGVLPAALPALAASVATLERLALRGLMCIPPPETDPLRQRGWFRRLRELRDELNGAVSLRTPLDTLSMGMSDDFEAAVLEGATIVRLGTVLFGPRPVQ